MFSESLKYGEYGEHAIWNLLNKQDEIRSVIDVRQDKGFQEKDIDFWIENQQRQFRSIEVKTDFRAHETGNLAYELTTSGNVGCLEKTQADIIIFFIPKSRQAHLVKTSVLREYVKNAHLEEIRMGDNATGYLLSIADLKRRKVINKTYNEVI